MPELGSLALVPLVFGLTAFGPGFWLIRRLDWRPVEKATAALALSFLLVGLASFGIGVLRLHPALRDLLLAACTAATLASIPGVASLLKAQEARQTLLWFSILALWCVALQALVRNYSGGNLVFDWLNHYERSKFFLGGQPTAALLPSRPPLANAFAAQIMALTWPRFPCYELTAALMALLAYFPMLLVARLFSTSSGVPRILAITLMFQPTFVQNVSYTWTRMPAAFFVLAMVGFYVGGWREGDPRRTLFAFLCGAASILTHYSSAPYVLFLVLHYLLRVLPRRERPARELGVIVLAASLVLAPWFVWATTVYGGSAVVSTALASSGTPPPTAGANLVKTALNLRDLFVPHLLRDVPRDDRSSGLTWGSVRNDAFTLYQGNLPLAIGSLGCILLVAELLRSRRSPAAARADSLWFWGGFAAFAVVAGIAAQGGREPLGLAQTAQQPLIMLVVAFLAARFESWPRPLRCLAAAGLLVDAGLGVVLHFWLQSYPLDLPDGWRGPLGLDLVDLRLMMAEWNWHGKVADRHWFVADLLGRLTWIPAILAAVLFAAGALTLLRRAARRAA
ncbi:MAG TPA: hypothetical protein VFB95_03220 [Candidatus Cryosericum sp.]|nr:hypothetical protein [Candidatus Cryosericum sp.]